MLSSDYKLFSNTFASYVKLWNYEFMLQDGSLLELQRYKPKTWKTTHNPDKLTDSRINFAYKKNLNLLSV